MPVKRDHQHAALVMEMPHIAFVPADFGPRYGYVAITGIWVLCDKL